MTTRPPRMRHQEDDVQWAGAVGRGVLGNDPGTGKSRSMIEACDGGRVLVAAPRLVIEGGTWSDEIARWADHPELFTVAPYSQLTMRQAAENGGTRPTRGVRPDYRGPWDSVIYDEAHYIKNRAAKWSVAAHKISLQSDQAFCVTGSPIPNWAPELYMLLKIAHKEKAGDEQYGSFWRWAKRWFDCSPSRFSHGFPVVGELLGCLPTIQECLARPADDPCPHYLQFAQANLGDRYRRVRETDVLDLPEKTEITVRTPLSATSRRLYRSLKRDFIGRMGDGTEVIAWSRGRLNVMLDALTTSPWLIADPDTRPPVPQGGKLDRLAFDLVETPGPVLVLTHYRATTEAAHALARAAGRNCAYVHGGVTKTRAGQNIRGFKDGMFDCLVGTMDTLAEGHQLTKATTAIVVEESYKPYRNIQARRRIWRKGQTQPVRILSYLTPDTVDERKRDRLLTKTDRQARYLTAAEFAEWL